MQDDTLPTDAPLGTDLTDPEVSEQPAKQTPDYEQPDKAGEPTEPGAQTPPAAPQASQGEGKTPPASTPEAQAAAALLDALKQTPGIVTELLKGETVADVQASFTEAKKAFEAARQTIMQDVSANLPQGHAGQGVAPVPGTPLEMIQAGIKGK